MTKGLLFSSIILLLLFSCQKKTVIDSRAVLTQETLSIPTSADIINFEVLNTNTIYAACHSELDDAVSIFLTEDGGYNWIEINPPVPMGEEILSLVFLDIDNGAIIVDRKVYITSDRGANWTLITTQFGHEIETFFLKANGDSSYILFENSYQQYEDIHEIQKGSVTFNTIDTYHCGSVFTHAFGVLANDKVFFLNNSNSSNVTMYNGGLTGYDTSDFVMPQVSGITHGSRIKDIIFGDNEYLIVREDGSLRTLKSTDQGGHSYDDGWLEYESCIYMGGYYIAVGDHRISTDCYGDWEEVTYPDGSSVGEYFTEIVKISSTEFFLSGKNGVFYKGTLL
jgi:hypothetical protein